jgi:hypothetical protein
VIGKDDRALTQALRSEATRSRVAVMSGTMNLPYKCIGVAILMAQQAGLKVQGFTPEAPLSH